MAVLRLRKESRHAEENKDIQLVVGWEVVVMVAREVVMLVIWVVGKALEGKDL